MKLVIFSSYLHLLVSNLLPTHPLGRGDIREPAIKLSQWSHNLETQDTDRKEGKPLPRKHDYSGKTRQMQTCVHFEETNLTDKTLDSRKTPHTEPYSLRQEVETL
ncbi:unnamed protein product [Boreogadus saida]